MPPAAAPPAAAAAGGDQPQQQQRGGFLQGFIRMALMWYMFQQFQKSGTNKGTSPSSSSPSSSSPSPASGSAHPLLPRGTPIDVHMWVSEHPIWTEALASGEPPIWIESNIPLATPSPPRTATYLYHPSDVVKNNGSVYVHTVFVPTGASPHPEDEGYDAALTWALTRPLHRYLPKRRAEQGVNLLSGKNSTGDEGLDVDTVKHNETVIVSYLKPNITVSLVDEFGSYPLNKIPPHLLTVLDVDPTTQAYKPVTWYNDFWLLRDKLVAMNYSVDTVPLQLSIEPLGPWKFAFFVQMEQSFEMQQTWGMSSATESDEIKRIFLDSNPYFLVLTVAVSMLHSVFDVLAFKNDIGFWKNNKSMKGLSARTIIINAACQFIIFLYLLDNDTSFVVLFSTGVGTAIECWKITKAMDVTVQRTEGGLPYLSFKDRASYIESKTDRYDADAMRYMSYVLYPVILGYAIYALVYQTHKSWYSWILNSLVSFVYGFGFALLIPQLYLNYKLKSVAHLPWKQMTYKFLSTIIDDLFAFVVKMPLLHRVAVFRDDVVFLIYLYQRWVYRVDKTRVNEFGYAEEIPEGEEEEKEKEKEEVAVAEESKKDK